MSRRNQGCLSSYFAISWHLADVIFAPRECFLGEDDEEIAAIYKRRSIIGAVIILCVSIRYHHFNGISETTGAVYQGIFWTIEFSSLSVIPAGVAVVLYTRRKQRKRALVQMKYPGSALAASWLLIFGAFPLTSRLTGHIPRDAGLALLVIVTALAAELWFASFTVRALYLMATGFFRLRDGHPLLQPVVTVLAAWVLAIKGLLASGGNEGEPKDLAVLLLIGGPLSLSALAAVEIERLKRKYPDDFPFRNGPLRTESSGSASATRGDGGSPV